MESGTSFPSAGSPSVTTRKQRPRLLHTCGVSVLTIARKAYAKAEGLNSPIGSLTLTLTTHAGPFVNTLLSQWLAILCFTDDQILAAEKVVETLFPPSVYVFDKVDTVVHIAEILPGKFDNVVNLFEVMIHRVPFLDSAASQMIWVLNFLVSTLKDWGSDGAKEKDIMVDINCNEQRELASDKKPQTNEDEGINPTSIEKSLPPMDENGQTETTTGTVRNKSSLEGGANLKTYKEVLQMGNGGNVEKKEGDEKETGETMVCTGETPKGAEMDKGNVEKKEGDKKETQETMVCKGETPMEAEMDTNGPNKEVEEVPILELFDAGWHMKA